jgi:ABC-2 type transport system ATP-binding protein
MNPRIKITVENLRVDYDNHTALNSEGLLEMEGNVLALIGHNGAGKSTLIKTILGLLIPKLGKVNAYLLPSEGDPRLLTPEKDMAFCPESGSVFSDIKVESYIKLWCRMKKDDSNYYKKEGAKYIEMLDIKPLLTRFGRELSKGQRRRVQTAIGFLIEPALFLIDEPFDGLDVQKTHELTTHIRALSPNMCFIVSSHRMDVMERISDYVIVLKEGRFIAHGGVEQVTNILSEVTYVVDVTENEDLHNAVNQHFPQYVINRIGGYLTLTGKGLSADVITKFFAKQQVPIKDLRSTNPSLVDAMTYHLRN